VTGALMKCWRKRSTWTTSAVCDATITPPLSLRQNPNLRLQFLCQAGYDPSIGADPFQVILHSHSFICPMNAIQIPCPLIDLVRDKPQDAFQCEVPIVLGICPSRHEKWNDSHSLNITSSRQ